jgi:hypothetical protein
MILRFPAHHVLLLVFVVVVSLVSNTSAAKQQKERQESDDERSTRQQMEEKVVLLSPHSEGGPPGSVPLAKESPPPEKLSPPPPVKESLVDDVGPDEDLDQILNIDELTKLANELLQNVDGWSSLIFMFHIVASFIFQHMEKSMEKHCTKVSWSRRRQWTRKSRSKIGRRSQIC